MSHLSPVAVSGSERCEIRALYNINTRNELKTIIEQFKIVLKPHQLPKESEDEWFLEIILLRAKFNLEKAERNILSYFNNIGKYYGLIKDLGNFVLEEQQCVFLTSLKLTPQFERITVIQLVKSNIVNRPLDWEQMTRCVMACAFLNFHLDYCVSIRFILDFDGVTLLHLHRLKPSLVHKAAKIVQNIAKGRISGIDLLNAPSIVNILLPLAKMALSAKLLKRMTVHRDLESLYQIVPKDYLPIEYGGKWWKSDLLIEKWKVLLDKEQEILRKIDKLSEKLQSPNELEDDLKTLTVD